MQSVVKIALIGAAVALCAWAFSGAREADEGAVRAAGAVGTSTVPKESGPSFQRWLTKEPTDPTAAARDEQAMARLDASPAPMTDQRPGIAVGGHREAGSGGVQGHRPPEATESSPSVSPLATRPMSPIALPPGVRADDVSISQTGMVTLLRSPAGPSDSAAATQPDDGPGYGAAAVPGRPFTRQSN